jgi:transcriptional regulator with XRE-family HTH domain
MLAPEDWRARLGLGDKSIWSSDQKLALGRRILEAREELGWSQRRMDDYLGMTTVHRWENTERLPSVLSLLGLAQLLGKSPRWFLGIDSDRDGWFDRSGASPLQERLEVLLRCMVAGARSTGVPLESLLGMVEGPADSSEESWVGSRHSRLAGLLPVEASAGAGAEVLEEVLVDHVRLNRAWLRQHSVSPDHCDVISVTGESMEPTLPDGCNILVDRSSRELRDGRIFVIREASGLLVKRLRRNDDRWWLVSDNAEWMPTLLGLDSVVVGEVRWMGRLV